MSNPGVKEMLALLDALKSANRGLFVSRPAIAKRVYIPAYHAQPTGAGDA